MVTDRLNNFERNCSYCYCNINVVIISKSRTGRLPGEGEDEGGKNNISAGFYKRTHKEGESYIHVCLTRMSSLIIINEYVKHLIPLPNWLVGR